MPNEAERPRRPRRVTVDPDGPVLVEGPVEMVAEDGTVVTSDRFVVAVCTCRRSRAYPWCDTSHRSRTRPPAAERRSPAPRPERGQDSQPERGQDPRPERGQDPRPEDDPRTEGQGQP